MKKIFFLLLLPCLTIAQNKNDNTIIAKGVTFKQVVNILLDADYRIDKIDSNYYTVRTEYNKLLCANCMKFDAQVMFDIRIKDSAAIIKGQVRINLGIYETALTNRESKYRYEEIIYQYDKTHKGAMEKGFNEMDRITKLLSSNVTYTKQ